MLELIGIKLSVFAYVTEENQRVVQALKNCLPSPLRNSKLEKVSIQNQFGDPIVIYNFVIQNSNEVINIVAYIGSKLNKNSRDYLTRHISKKIDLDDHRIFLRLDKFKAYDETIYPIEGSDIIKVEIQYAAYTQEDNTLEGIIETLQQCKLVN